MQNNSIIRHVRTSRVALAIITGATFFAFSFASAMTMYSDSFESAGFASWTEVDSTGNGGLWKIDTARYDGKYSAFVSGKTGGADDVLRKAISTDTYSGSELSFYYKVSGLDYRASSKNGSVQEFDRFFVEYSTDGASWVVLKELNGKNIAYESATSWTRFSAVVPSHPNFQFRFRAKFTDTGDRVWVDAVAVSGTPLENSITRCTDNIDNDGDGFTDGADSSCDAHFANLRVTTLGDGTGLVTSNPGGIYCGVDCFEQYLRGISVTLSSATLRGSVFLGWGGACSGNADCLLTLSTSTDVTASYSALPSNTLTVENIPAGGGRITSQPAGIDCGADCAETIYGGESFEMNAEATLGYMFTGWTGDCVGILPCIVVPGADVHVVANYDAIPPGVCGNAIVEWNESCDDSNLVGGDGCSAQCRIESWELVCEGTLSYPICRIVMIER